MEPLTCAISGHRFASLPFGTNEAADTCRKLESALKDKIIDLIESRGVTRFICGMALGTDQICAEIILDLREKYPGIELICLIPCAEQSQKWNKAQKSRYQQILLDSDETICLSDTYTKDCMQQRNRIMVDQADILLAVWNQRPRGGTAAPVRYACSKDLPIILIDPYSL